MGQNGDGFLLDVTAGRTLALLRASGGTSGGFGSRPGAVLVRACCRFRCFAGGGGRFRAGFCVGFDTQTLHFATR